ncbi:MAG TPA: sodium:solute symporter family protein [Candidatus Marinimicrobia bacterium]|jgi:Na+/proline symporter|nr:Na+:solute symporter [Candidatus Neomarinimicrobiota bacterium]MDP7529196.1 Na+:solute symporter [Candidatus Neomarinimicrobiota bacterium]MDP7715251.1 Na+:solute symporter [Candidatus Neomarinimicrobiota bacterium]HJL84425.1 sodium:solute symporter family protein [Candidatus Neomarinimicrobiota bacterium]HJM11059.1 sodium:solute symporter family protein [Candidatus Neomarinimicrobiota bacterium]|tara:strand:- start:2959 stop:4707 length:1749 start_codon:yes stop_codon:yes gene_type:complete
MTLSYIDWVIVFAYFILSLVVGIWASKKAGRDTQSFFLAGRNMPWWLLGVSMVATTFSTDTPNLVTDLVRQNGVSGNWAWWAFLLTGMLTVFVYANLWRRSGVLTDIEFYELRYSGAAAAFLRGFRALYLGLIFNVLVMGSVSLAAIKFGEIVLGWPGWMTLTIACSITLVYSALGGLKAIIITDFVQFILAMTGSIWACIYLLGLEQVGGLANLLTSENVADKLALIPDLSNPDVWVPVLLVPLAVQWWASYYPGAEPGGGGYIAQRMFSAKDETNAVGATFLFNVAHYALRPWPWILIALSSLVVFPQLTDIQAAFPNLPLDKLGHDVAYPAMLTLLPAGLLGLVAASLIAAFMSTMSTQLNLGASYLVNDFYHRFLKPEAGEKELVWAGRMFTIVSVILGAGLGLILTSAAQAFSLLLLLGAGTGLIYILRWFWWRINAYTEIVAMVTSLIIASYFNFVHDKLGLYPLESWQKIVIGAVLTTTVWIVATFFTRPDSDETLQNFVMKVNPGGPGWKRFSGSDSQPWPVPRGILSMVLGCTAVYGFLLGTGHIIYGSSSGVFLLGLASVASVGLFKVWNSS